MKKIILIGTLYSIIVSTICLYYIVSYHKEKNPIVQDELTVQRINIVEPDGSLKMVLSNSENQHNGIINGDTLPAREKPAGIIFFNSIGDECGGLVFDGNGDEAGLVLSVDQFRNDQIMQLQYMEDVDSKNRKYGLQLWDYPKENSYAERNLLFNRMEQMTSQKKQDSLYEKMKIDSLLMEDRLFIGKNFLTKLDCFLEIPKAIQG